jgi:hypothetical protein
MKKSIIIKIIIMDLLNNQLVIQKDFQQAEIIRI